MRIVTAGKPYMDIDAYGGVVAYAELLKKQGVSSLGASSSVLNSSITPTVRSWKAPLATSYKPIKEDTFTIIDLSNFDYLDPMVDIERVDEIIDHHPGFEEFWRKRIGDKAHIEPVGAACTLVFERWQQAGMLDHMSGTSARVLICGILDNTLNFGAILTTDRDHKAYEKLLPIAKLPKDWTAHYFSECQAGVLKNIPKAIDDDFKSMTLPGWAGELQGGQLAAWDPTDLLGKGKWAIKMALANKGQHWFMNVIAIGEGHSYFICEDAALQEWLAELLDVTFTGDVATAKRMWLRKEIVAHALQRAGVKSLA